MTPTVGEWYSVMRKTMIGCIICGMPRNSAMGFCLLHEMAWLESPSVPRAKWALQQRVALLIKRLRV